MNDTYYIIDFDSTFVSVEALDELARISLKDSHGKDQILEKFRSITNDAMAGKISFPESLKKRLALINADKNHLEDTVKFLSGKISKSVKRNRSFFRKYSDKIIVISGGFREIIEPIVAKFGIEGDKVYANEFTFDKHGRITGLVSSNILSQKNGKINQLKALKLNGTLTVIGDGYTDYELKKAGIAHKFFAFTENVERKSVTEMADHVAPSIDEILYVSKLPMSISYPKNRISVVLLENIHKDAADIFRDEGYSVETLDKSPSTEILAKLIKDASVIGIRSKTQLSKDVISKSNRLLAIGTFCIGTNQVDLNACLLKGIPVFNAPFSNTRSVVELALGQMIMLMRKIFDKSYNLHQGKWDKSASSSYEIRGKRIGIIGYGKIGSQLSVLAEDLGMEVYFYDVVERLALGNARKCKTLNELLRRSDIVTIHIDGRKENTNFIGERELGQMKNGSILLNLSRGHVVDIEALAKNLKSGKLRGASVDVFPEEPAGNDNTFRSALQGIPNVILTPHIGGSTEEAQKDIGNFVPKKIIDFINNGNTFNSVNFPELQLPKFQNAHRLIHIHRNVPGILAQINNVLASHKINITGQYLKTNEVIGYVITDISKKYNPQVIHDLKKIPDTIKFRVLY